MKLNQIFNAKGLVIPEELSVEKERKCSDPSTSIKHAKKYLQQQP